MSSSASELTTVTEERTEISVEREEVTLYECPCCEQTVGEDELANVDVGEESTAICDYCADSLFDISIEECDEFDPVAAAGSGVDTVTDKLVKPLARLAIMLIPVGGGVWIFANAMDGMSRAESDIAESSELMIETMPDVLATIPALVLIFTLVLVIPTILRGPRI